MSAAPDQTPTKSPLPGITGIDVSAWQPHIDWNKVALAGHRYAFVKATEGQGYVSPTFAAQRQGALDAGLLTGCYHFAQWLSDPRKQAEHFASTIGAVTSGELSPVLDLEWYSLTVAGEKVQAKLSPYRLVEWAIAFLEHAESLLGRRLILYTGPSFWGGNLRPAGELAMMLTGWPLWVAKYQSTPPTMRGAPDWNWDWWQFTGSGAVPGVTMARGGGPLKKCDINVFRGSEKELRLFAGQA